MDSVILKRPDHLEPGSIADVSKPRVPVSAEITLEDTAVGGPIEHRAPRLELADAIRRLLRVQLRHAPVVHVLAAAHRVGEMHLPAVAIVDVGERRGDAAFRHHRVRLAEKRLADESDRRAAGRGLDCRPQPRPACADHEHVVVVGLVLRHQRIRMSDHTPMEHKRTYKSEKPTANRLVQAHAMCRRLRQLTHS